MSQDTQTVDPAELPGNGQHQLVSHVSETLEVDPPAQ